MSFPSPAEKQDVLSDQQFFFIIDLVKSTSGIQLDPKQKRELVSNRLMRRLRKLNLNTYQQYIDFLKSSPGELTAFTNAITTNHTFFFREEHHFEHLAEYLKIRLRRHNTDQPFRLWCSAASSGEEPYSISMIMQESIPNLNKLDCKLLATDIDTDILEKARAGIYAEKVLESIPTPLHQYVEQRGEFIHVKPKLKESVFFKQLNLLKDWPIRAQYQIVFCRNVMIYFDKPTKERLVNRFADQLETDGVLYVGHSENVLHLSDRFELIGKTIYRKVK